jgi:hypothetical protein
VNGEDMFDEAMSNIAKSRTFICLMMYDIEYVNHLVNKMIIDAEGGYYE